MRSKYLFLKLFVMTAIVLAGVGVARAQVSQLRGKVVMVQADGSTVPLAGATIDVFRTDIAGKWETKSEKNGDFVFAGLPFVGTYIISVSAPNARPEATGGVRLGNLPEGQLPQPVTLVAGDGKRLTLAEAKEVSGGGGAPRGSETASDKAKRAEDAKRTAELAASNKRAEESNKIIGEKFNLSKDAINAAQLAIKAKNTAEAERLLGEAVKQIDEGVAADPTHPGVPSLLTNKALALNERAVLRYNSTITSEQYKAAVKAGDASTTAMMAPAKQDWTEAFASGKKAVELFKTQTTAQDATSQANLKHNMYFALSVFVDVANKMVSKVDPSQVEAGITAYREYLEVETDAAKKSKAQLDLAQMLFDANAYDQAQAAYEKILTANPDDPDALVKIGMVLFNQGAMRDMDGKKDEAKVKYQEAANYLQRFVEKAPDGHKFKADAQAVLEELKNQQNVKAEKVSTPARRRRP